jgi:hypothetical protein
VQLDDVLVLQDQDNEQHQENERPPVPNQAAAARVVARVLDEGVAARWLFGGALASGLTAPEILGVFAWCYLRTLVQMILLRAAPTRWITLQHLLKDAGTRERRSASTQVPFFIACPVTADSDCSGCQPKSHEGEAEPGEHGQAQEATKGVHPTQHLVPGPQRESRRGEDDQDGVHPTLGVSQPHHR